MIGAGIADLIDERTKLVWVESPGSGTMEVQDVPAIVAAAKSRGALVGCDNTWASPLLFKPLAHGADFAIEALTKYVGGHSDLLLGSITLRDLDLRQQIKDTLRMVGIGVSPDEAALALRGIETMGVRLAHMGRVSEAFARRLQHLPAVETARLRTAGAIAGAREDLEPNPHRRCGVGAVAEHGGGAAHLDRAAARRGAARAAGRRQPR